MSTPTETRNFVTWSEKYSVGITRIDQEHQRLMDLLNELHVAVTAGRGADVVGKVLAGLASYTITHFTNEEMLLRTHKYPDYQRHREQHQELIDVVQQLQRDFRTGKADISKETLLFLQRWLIGHILGVDRKYAPHLKAAGVT